MNVHVTEHAKERLMTRLGVSPAKIAKVAHKAWRSSERVQDGEVANRSHYEREYAPQVITYRKLMGQIYTFAVRDNENAALVTVYQPSYKAGNERNIKKQAEGEKIFYAKAV